MWNLSGNDIHRAKEELKSRRAAIKARYDSEIKQLEVDIAAIETFERAAVDFMSSFKLEGAVSAPVAGPGPAPAPAPDKIAPDNAQKQHQPTSAPTPVEKGVAAEPVPEPAPNPEPAAAEKSSSRWRMRLNTREGSS
jgi:hypothetical protein